MSGQLTWYVIGAGVTACALAGTLYYTHPDTRITVHRKAFDLAYTGARQYYIWKQYLEDIINGTDFFAIKRVLWLHNDHRHAEDITQRFIQTYGMYTVHTDIESIRDQFELLNGGYLYVQYEMNRQGLVQEYIIIYDNTVQFPPYRIADIPNFPDDEILYAVVGIANNSDTTSMDSSESDTGEDTSDTTSSDTSDTTSHETSETSDTTGKSETTEVTEIIGEETYDITDIMQQYAGPKCNFYKDMPDRTILYKTSIYIDRICGGSAGGLFINSTDNLTILTNNGETTIHDRLDTI